MKTEDQKEIALAEASSAHGAELGGLPCSPMWEAYGPTISPLTMEHESSVGPTDINDVAGPLCIVSGDTDEESLRNAQRIAELLNLYGLANDQGDS